MEKSVTPKRGRPRVQEVAEPAATKKKRKVITRQKDASKEPKLYEIVGPSGIYYKLRSSKVLHFDNEKNSVRELRYCSTEPSVFADEQSERAVRNHVVFRDGRLLVRVDQPNLLQYLELHPDNQANGGNVFRLVNEEVNHEEVIENEFLIHDAITLIKSRPIDELLPLAMALNIDVNQSPLAVKRALVTQAKSNPKKFLETNNNPLVEARSSVQQALDFQIVSNKGGAVVWTDTNKMVVSVPAGMDAIEVLTRFVMTDQGASVLDEIDRQLAEIAS